MYGAASVVCWLSCSAMLVMSSPTNRISGSDRLQTTPEKTETCRYENATYSAGERFRPTPCTYCHCPKHGGRPLCAIQDCVWEPNCLKYDHKFDECCGTCLEHGCHHIDGKVYKAESVVKDSECEMCVCPEDGGTVICTPKFVCPRVNCVDMVLDPGTCCPRCPNGKSLISLRAFLCSKRSLRSGYLDCHLLCPSGKSSVGELHGTCYPR